MLVFAMLTYEHVSSLAGEVGSWLQGLLVAGHHSHTLSRRLQSLFVHLQIPYTAHEACGPGELERAVHHKSQTQKKDNTSMDLLCVVIQHNQWYIL